MSFSYPTCLVFVYITFVLINGTMSRRKVINFIPPAAEMPPSEVIDYFRVFLRVKTSSYDSMNEQVFYAETLPEELYHNIDNLLPFKNFNRYLVKTKNITDKLDYRGNSLLKSYPGTLNAKCDEGSMFNYTLNQILKFWDGDRSMTISDLDKWQAANAKTPASQICNRFRGLTCQYKVSLQPDKDQGEVQEPDEKNPTCQCAGEGKNVGFFKNQNSRSKSISAYPDGCYIRPWRSCRHLSLDSAFREYYFDSHTSLEGQKRILAQIIFPIARIHRCRQGTYCLDLVAGMNRPVCWCAKDSKDPECVDAFEDKEKKVIPIGIELVNIRRTFLKLFIPANDTTTKCDRKFNNIIKEIAKSLGGNPAISGEFLLIQELANRKKDGLKICDFRRGFTCNASSVCSGKWACDPGKIHLGNGVCAADNGSPCQSNEDCVENAHCEKLLTESACVCEYGYGQRCLHQAPSFFGKLFLPVISGFMGEDFVSLQVKIESTLESFEDNMNRNVGEKCDPSLDPTFMEIVKYFGNLEIYNMEIGDELLHKAKALIQDGPKLCYYNKFLRCDHRTNRCVPMKGSIIGSQLGKRADSRKIVVEVLPDEECDLQSIPKIFHDEVKIVCFIGYTCQQTCRPDCNSVFAPKTDCAKMGAGGGTGSEEKDMTEEPPITVSTSKTTKKPGKPHTNISTDMTPHPHGTFTTSKPNPKSTTTPGSSETIEPATPPTPHQNPETTKHPEHTSGPSTKPTPPGTKPTPPGTKPTPPGTKPTPPGPTKPTPPGTKPTPPGTTKPTPPGTKPTPPGTTKPTPPGTKPTPPGPTKPTPPGTKPTPPGPTKPTPPGTKPTPPGPTKPTPPGTKPTPPGPTKPTPPGPTKPTPPGTKPTPSGPGTKPRPNSNTSTITTRPGPAEKAQHGAPCNYSEDHPTPTDISLTCDASLFLFCYMNEACHCHPPLVYSRRKGKCMVPVGHRCELTQLRLPRYLHSHYAGLECEYGKCRTDTAGKICRPRTDLMLILVPFDRNADRAYV